MREVNAIMTLSYRDLMKLLRDPPRMAATFIFPLLFIGILGGSLQSAFEGVVPYSFLAFTFTGVLAQTLFQSTAMGVISLLEDRENDFSQEIFVSPISRYSIVFGKILGESLVALPQALAIVIFGVLLGVEWTPARILALIPASIAACLFGGAFGVMVLANLGSQRSANQVFPFVMLPQFFLAGVFNPIHALPWYLDILSRISPMRYAVDLTRGLFFAGHSDYAGVVLESPVVNLAVMSVLFLVFISAGTFLFVRAERNR